MAIQTETSDWWMAQGIDAVEYFIGHGDRQIVTVKSDDPKEAREIAKRIQAALNSAPEVDEPSNENALGTDQ